VSSISPNEIQIRELVNRIDDGPVVMINLLKFRERALEGDESGAAAYARYARAVGGMIQDLGGRTVWAGRADQVLIGDSEQDWDLAVLIEYPTRRAFLEMTSQPEYQRIHSDRSSGLERTSLIACTPIDGAISWSDFAGAQST
jgi:uncharacterized protein (DUF1330 family)